MFSFERKLAGSPGIKLSAVLEGAGVVHREHVARLGLAVAYLGGVDNVHLELTSTDDSGAEECEERDESERRKGVHPYRLESGELLTAAVGGRGPLAGTRRRSRPLNEGRHPAPLRGPSAIQES